jgi:DNA-directed RNA polymerase subunit RPC12/RpoP
MWNAEFNLYLYSESPCAPEDYESLHNALLSCELIGEKISDTSARTRYQTGEKFLSLLCFMGCSPNIELEPQDDKPYCYIELENTQRGVKFISGKNLRKYQCPECKQKIENIGELINTALDNKIESISCPHCNYGIHYKNINWRKTGFIANNWIVIGNIYESEAIPDGNLLSTLEKITGTRWKFAYIRTEN